MNPHSFPNHPRIVLCDWVNSHKHDKSQWRPIVVDTRRCTPCEVSLSQLLQSRMMNLNSPLTTIWLKDMDKAQKSA